MKSHFEYISIGEQAYWFTRDIKIPAGKKPSGFLLPPFDEYIIAYADRSALVTDEAKKKNLFDNGLFRNVILINGKAAGTWKRVIKKNKMGLELNYFKAPSKSTVALVKKAAKEYGKFIEEKVPVI